MSTTTAERFGPAPPPPAFTVGWQGWLRMNLFNSWSSGILTIVLGVALFLAALGGVRWLIFSSDWAVITDRVPLYIVGTYPREYYWRPEIALLLVSGLMGMAWRTWGGPARGFAAAFGALVFVVALIPYQMDVLYRALLLAVPAAMAGGYYCAHFIPEQGRAKWFGITGAGVLIVSLLVIAGFSLPGVGPPPGLHPVTESEVGGLMLNLLLAAFGIIASLPIGIALALGRRSRLPVLKFACVAFIETIRGVPLITLLFMSRHILPLTFPENIDVSLLYLSGITITIFSSAYMAENVRGGMAAVSPQQSQAAQALGLKQWQTTLFVTLPQGLRNIIPAIVGQFISLFKDTSLVFIIGMLDLVEIGRAGLSGKIEYSDNGMEVYLFLALVFWVFTFSMAYISRRIERTLGVGRR
jgi:general L-amino acid transport system permease protein